MRKMIKGGLTWHHILVSINDTGVHLRARLTQNHPSHGVFQIVSMVKLLKEGKKKVRKILCEEIGLHLLDKPNIGKLTHSVKMEHVIG